MLMATNDSNRSFYFSFIFAGILLVVWLVLTGKYNTIILHAYVTTVLPTALLTIDSIFFGAITIITSVIIGMTGTPGTYKHAIGITKLLRSLSIGVAVLSIANISSYFTSGWVHTLTVFYQVWMLPAMMFIFYFYFQQP